MNYLLLGGLVLILALALLWLAGRKRRASGLPPGRVIATDTSAWRRLEKPLYDPLSELTGRPDYLVEENGRFIPVEVKSSWAPPVAYDSHIFQLAAYCLLVERTMGNRPPYGILRYRNRTFAIDNTPELQAALGDLLVEMRLQERKGDAARSHEEPGRCARCGYRSICDQSL